MTFIWDRNTFFISALKQINRKKTSTEQLIGISTQMLYLCIIKTCYQHKNTIELSPTEKKSDCNSIISIIISIHSHSFTGLQKWIHFPEWTHGTNGLPLSEEVTLLGEVPHHCSVCSLCLSSEHESAGGEVKMVCGHEVLNKIIW